MMRFGHVGTTHVLYTDRERWAHGHTLCVHVSISLRSGVPSAAPRPARARLVAQRIPCCLAALRGNSDGQRWQAASHKGIRIASLARAVVLCVNPEVDPDAARLVDPFRGARIQRISVDLSDVGAEAGHVNGRPLEVIMVGRDAVDVEEPPSVPNRDQLVVGNLFRVESDGAMRPDRGGAGLARHREVEIIRDWPVLKPVLGPRAKVLRGERPSVHQDRPDRVEVAARTIDIRMPRPAVMVDIDVGSLDRLHAGVGHFRALPSSLSVDSGDLKPGFHLFKLPIADALLSEGDGRLGGHDAALPEHRPDLEEAYDNQQASEVGNQPSGICFPIGIVGFPFCSSSRRGLNATVSRRGRFRGYRFRFAGPRLLLDVVTLVGANFLWSAGLWRRWGLSERRATDQQDEEKGSRRHRLASLHPPPWTRCRATWDLPNRRPDRRRCTRGAPVTADPPKRPGLRWRGVGSGH